MTWSLWTAPRGALSVRPLRDLTEAEAPAWRDRTPPAGLGGTGTRSAEDRLGWVDLPLTAASELPEYGRLREELLAEGFRRLVVVAMGGSALAPRALVSGLRRDAGLDVEFLDSLAPEAVREAVRPDRLPQTVFAVASKSGTTVETRSLEAVIFRALRDAGAVPGRQLLAVADPGTPLHEWADHAGYRRWFAGRVDVGGRFSALTAFGLLPATLAGYALEDELKAVRRVREALDGDSGADDPAFRLGALLARLRAGGTVPGVSLRVRRSPGSAPLAGTAPLGEHRQTGGYRDPAGHGGSAARPELRGRRVLHPPRPGGRRGPGTAGGRRALGGFRSSTVLPVPRGFRVCSACRSRSRWRLSGWGWTPTTSRTSRGTKAAARRLLEDSGPVPTPPAVSAGAIERFLAQAARGGLVINAFGHRDRTARGKDRGPPAAPRSALRSCARGRFRFRAPALARADREGRAGGPLGPDAYLERRGGRAHPAGRRARGGRQRDRRRRVRPAPGRGGP